MDSTLLTALIAIGAGMAGTILGVFGSKTKQIDYESMGKTIGIAISSALMEQRVQFEEKYGDRLQKIEIAQARCPDIHIRVNDRFLIEERDRKEHDAGLQKQLDEHEHEHDMDTLKSQGS